MTAEELWATKYAQRHAEERFKEEARREQAFLDLPALVSGEPLRMMTPRDLLVLNGIESPFVCPREMTAADVAIFFWVLHAENDGGDTWRNRRRRSAMIRRLAPKSAEEVVESARDYVDEVFQDAPQATVDHENRRPLGTCFLAPLVVSIALETGWSQEEILSTPLPRLFQYKKAIRARSQGKDFTDFSPSDKLTDDFLCELNATRN